MTTKGSLLFPRRSDLYTSELLDQSEPAAHGVEGIGGPDHGIKAEVPLSAPLEEEKQAYAFYQGRKQA